MKKIGKAGLALVIAGALIFGAGYIGARGDLSVVNGNIGPFRVQLADGHVHSGFFHTDSSSKPDSSQSGIGGGRNKPVTTPPPVPTPVPTSQVSGSGHGSSGHDEHEQHHTDTASQSFSAEKVKSVKIDEVNADVEILPSEDGQIHVSAEKRDDFYCTVENSGGVLKIERKSSITINFGFGLTVTPSTLRVELPQDIYCRLEIENSCGNVSVSGLTLGEVDIEANLGDISFEDIQCTDAELDADCGGIYAGGVVCTGDFKAEAAMGDVTVEGVSVLHMLKAESDCGTVSVSNSSAENAEVSSDMGDISAVNLVCEKTVKLDCDCGAVDFEALSAGKSIEIENSMGSVSGTLAGRFEAYSIESKASLGSNNLPEYLGRSGVQLKVFTSCGSIDVRFEES